MVVKKTYRSAPTIVTPEKEMNKNRYWESFLVEYGLGVVFITVVALGSGKGGRRVRGGVVLGGRFGTSEKGFFSGIPSVQRSLTGSERSEGREWGAGLGNGCRCGVGRRRKGGGPGRQAAGSRTTRRQSLERASGWIPVSSQPHKK